MVQNEKECDRVALELEKCSKFLCNAPGCSDEGGEPVQHPLRELQRVARSVMYEGKDPYVRTVAFILDLWIEDFYFNFAGDVLSPASEAVDKIREKFLTESLGPLLGTLSEVVLRDSASGLGVFEKIATSYLDARLEANVQVGGW